METILTVVITVLVIKYCTVNTTQLNQDINNIKTFKHGKNNKNKS